MRKIKLLIADGHGLLREGLALLLNSDPRFCVVGATGCGVHAVALTAALRPDVVLLDINLPRLNGVEAVRRIRQQAPRTRVVALSLAAQWGLARPLLQGGALGYVTRNSPCEELITALQQVAQNDCYICREVRDRLLPVEEEGTGGTALLTQREREVLDHVCRGGSSREIATALQLSRKTVETHRYHILKKLALPCTTALIDYVHRHGLRNGNKA